MYVMAHLSASVLVLVLVSVAVSEYQEGHGIIESAIAVRTGKIVG